MFECSDGNQTVNSDVLPNFESSAVSRCHLMIFFKFLNIWLMNINKSFFIQYSADLTINTLRWHKCDEDICAQVAVKRFWHEDDEPQRRYVTAPPLISAHSASVWTHNMKALRQICHWHIYVLSLQPMRVETLEFGSLINTFKDLTIVLKTFPLSQSCLNIVYILV